MAVNCTNEVYKFSAPGELNPLVTGNEHVTSPDGTEVQILFLQLNWGVKKLIDGVTSVNISNTSEKEEVGFHDM